MAGELRLSKLGMLRVGLETMRYTPRDMAREVDKNPMDRGAKSRLRTLVARQATNDAVSRVLHGVAAVGRATARSRRGPFSAEGRPVRVSPQHRGAADALEIGRTSTHANSRS